MSAMTFREQALAAFDHELPDVVPSHQMGFAALQSYVEQSKFDTAQDLFDSWGIGSGRLMFVGPTWNGPKKTNEEGQALDPFVQQTSTYNQIQGGTYSSGKG